MSPNRPQTVGPFSPEHPRNCFASTVHGLEDLAADELAALGYRVRSIRKRQVLATAPDAADAPRTADDLLVQVAETPDPGPTKADLAKLGPLLATADLSPVSADLANGDLVLTVSASISGHRTYNRHDLEAAIGPFLAERLDARFASRADGARPPHGAAEWRAVLGPDGLLLGYRGRRPPLHRRPWKTTSIPGTLHPPAAAAMARLAGIGTGMTVLDPCCGAGTITVEAAELAPGARIAGFDLDSKALAASAQNTLHRKAIALAHCDAARLPMRAGTVDRIVTNPAWGRQVAQRRRFSELLAEWRRIIAQDGRLVCLMPQEALRHFGSGWTIIEARPISLSGRHPVIAVAEPKAGRRLRRSLGA